MLFLFILIISLVLQLFLPWWIIAIVAFTLSWWRSRSGGHAFGHSFMAIFLLWVAAGLFRSIPNENILANRIGEMLTLPLSETNWILVLLITGIIGGLVAAFAGMAGYFSRNAFTNRQPERDLSRKR